MIARILDESIPIKNMKRSDSDIFPKYFANPLAITDLPGGKPPKYFLKFFGDLLIVMHSTELFSEGHPYPAITVFRKGVGEVAGRRIKTASIQQVSKLFKLLSDLKEPDDMDEFFDSNRFVKYYAWSEYMAKVRREKFL